MQGMRISPEELAPVIGMSPNAIRYRMKKWNAANRQRSKGRRHQREEKISIRHLHSESAGVYRIKGVAKMTTIIVNLLIIAAVFLVAYFAPGDRKGCFWEIMVPIIVTIATTVICIELRSLV